MAQANLPASELKKRKLVISRNAQDAFYYIVWGQKVIHLIWNSQHVYRHILSLTWNMCRIGQNSQIAKKAKLFCDFRGKAQSIQFFV